MKVKKFSKLTSVTTDDGDDVELSGSEAKALLKMFNMLSAQRAGEEQSPRERFIRAIQTTKGLESMTAFAKAKGLVEETAEEQPTLNFDDIRDDYSVEEGEDKSLEDEFEGDLEEAQEVDEVAGPKDCWDGYKKDGTKPGTGENKGKRVNNCVKEDSIQETTNDAMAAALEELKKLAGI